MRGAPTRAETGKLKALKCLHQHRASEVGSQSRQSTMATEEKAAARRERSREREPEAKDLAADREREARVLGRRPARYPFRLMPPEPLRCRPTHTSGGSSLHRRRRVRLAFGLKARE